MPTSNVNPKVSVCIFTYNHENYISDCLMSVLSQDINGEIEILVGDDASTDSTVSIIKMYIKRFPEKIHLYRQENNIGASRNLKFLIDKARGDFISHLDGDDYWLPGKLSAQLTKLESNHEYIAAFNNSVVINDDKSALGFFNNHIPEKFGLDYLLNKGNFLHHSTLLYRSKAKEIILKLPDEFIDYRIHIEIAKIGKFVYINQINSCYRVGSSSSMIVAMPEKVRLLYFEAILSSNKKNSAFRNAMTSFWSEILLTSIKQKKIKTIISWCNHITSIENFGWTVFTIGIIKAIQQLCLTAFIKLLNSAHTPKVLFPRGHKDDNK